MKRSTRLALLSLLASALLGKVAVENVRLGLEQIQQGSPYLAQRIDAGSVGLVGALYDVSTGAVTFLEPRKGSAR